MIDVEKRRESGSTVAIPYKFRTVWYAPTYTVKIFEVL